LVTGSQHIKLLPITERRARSWPTTWSWVQGLPDVCSPGV
jgi:hypothetical protein